MDTARDVCVTTNGIVGMNNELKVVMLLSLSGNIRLFLLWHSNEESRWEVRLGCQVET